MLLTSRVNASVANARLQANIVVAKNSDFAACYGVNDQQHGYRSQKTNKHWKRDLRCLLVQLHFSCLQSFSCCRSFSSPIAADRRRAQPAGKSQLNSPYHKTTTCFAPRQSSRCSEHWHVHNHPGQSPLCSSTPTRKRLSHRSSPQTHQPRNTSLAALQALTRMTAATIHQ